MVRINISEQELLRKRVYEFYGDNIQKGKHYTYQHFQANKISKSIMFTIMKRYDQGISLERQKGSGRIASKITKQKLKKLTSLIDHKDGISQRQVAKKLNCSQSYISKILKQKTSIKCRKKQKIPSRSDAQKKKIRTNCGRLYTKYKNHQWLMDDQSYFTLRHTHINGNSYYKSSNKDKKPNKVKYSPKAKYEEKLLVWVCISQKGISDPYYLPNNYFVNKEVYLNQCIKKKLVPFVNQYHSNDRNVFWPDLCTSHYAKIVTQYLDNNKITYVSKIDNPTNVPECRTIEDFWGILKGEVYKNNWEAKNIFLLKRKITQRLKKIGQSIINKLIQSVPTRLNNVRRYGLIEEQK